MAKYVAGIDMGTGGERCVIFNLQGETVGQAYREIPTLFPNPGWAEQDPRQMIENAYDATAEAIRASGVDPRDILGVSFSAFQSSFGCIDRSGDYLGNLILWQDSRGLQMFPWLEARLKENGMTFSELYRRSGQPLNVLVSGLRVMWLRQHMPEFYDRVWKFVTPLAMLVHAFGGVDWIDAVTDSSFFVVKRCEDFALDPELTRMFDHDPDKYPNAARPGTPAGAISETVAARTGLCAGTPVFVGVGDQVCAALGVGNYGTPEIASLSLGTGGLMMAYADAPVYAPGQFFHIIGFPERGYGLEAAMPVAAAALRWLRDMLYPADFYDRKDVFARMTAEAEASPLGANGIVFLPHLAGKVCPENDSNMRGAFAGLSLDTSRRDLIRATMEGICYEMREMLSAYREAGAGYFKRLRLLGGAANSDFWNQMQADIYGCTVQTMESAEVSALGAAMLAARGAGVYGNLQEACGQMAHVRKTFEPNAAQSAKYDGMYEAYLRCCRDLSRETFPHLAQLRTTEG